MPRDSSRMHPQETIREIPITITSPHPTSSPQTPPSSTIPTPRRNLAAERIRRAIRNAHDYFQITRKTTGQPRDGHFFTLNMTELHIYKSSSLSRTKPLAFLRNCKAIPTVHRLHTFPNATLKSHQFQTSVPAANYSSSSHSCPKGVP